MRKHVIPSVVEGSRARVALRCTCLVAPPAQVPRLTLGMTGRAGVTNEIGNFLDYLTYERNVSPNTIVAYRDDLESFTGFLCNDYFTMTRDQLELARVDHLAVRSYLAHLSRRKLARASIARHLSALRTFFKWLVREG